MVARLRAAGCVFAEDEAALIIGSARDEAELESLVGRREGGLPLEHVLGWAEFCGLRVEVDPGVFVPRPRSEFLVRQALGLARQSSVVLDLCCGSGALGLAVCSKIDWAELHASDIDPAAVACARRNLERVDGHVYQGDLYEPLPRSLRGRVDLLLVVAPYVPADAIALLPHEARDFEPLSALDGGPDGLVVLRRVLEPAREWLAAGGILATEVGEGQVPALVELVAGAGLQPGVIRDEELDATVVTGRYV